MYLTDAHVRDYRSIHDSGSIEIESRKTLLVGMNEAGKTALLKAIQQTKAPTTTEGFSALRDYPRSRYTDVQRGDRDPSDIVVIETTFALSDEDRGVVAAVAPDFTGVTRLKLYRYLDNSQSYNFGEAKLSSSYSDVEKDLARLRAHLADRDGVETVISGLDDLIRGCQARTLLSGSLATGFEQWLKAAFPFIDEDNAREEERYGRIRAAVTRNTQTQAAYQALLPRVPLFVYYSTYFTVRPRINLASLAAREASGDIDEEYDFGNLCLLKLLGLSAKELSELAAGEPQPSSYGGIEVATYKQAVSEHQKKLDDRQYRLNAASVDLTKAIRQVWGDEQVQLRLVPDGQYLKVVIVDDIGVEVELDQRSEGFRWLVSFFVVFKAQAQGDLKNAILLLDEPGLSLHALKQQEFRKTVSRIAEDNQVIYTTHSPFMVGTDELDLVRIVEMTDRESGTKVHTRLVVDDPRSVYPLQAALGYELAQSLFGQSRNLVCEGLTDMMYVEALNTALAEIGKGFRRNVAPLPASGASKVLYYCTLLVNQKLKVSALLDSDQAGENAAKQDELVALLGNKKILRTKDYCPSVVKGPEIEDLLRRTLVKIAKDDPGWDVGAKALEQPSRRIVDIFRAEIADFSKYKLARAFIRWLATHDISALAPDELDAVTALFADINKSLA